MPENIIHGNTSYSGLNSVNSLNSLTTSTTTGTEIVNQTVITPGGYVSSIPTPITYLNINGTFTASGGSVLNSAHASNLFSIADGLQVIKTYSNIFQTNYVLTVAALTVNGGYTYVLISDGTLYVLDITMTIVNTALLINAGDIGFQGTGGGSTALAGFTVNNNYIYLGYNPLFIGQPTHVKIFDTSSLTFLGYLGNDYQFQTLTGVQVDSTGKIYACDYDQTKTFLFNSNSDLAPTIFTTELYVLLAIDANNHLYGLGTNGDMVQLDKNGNILYSYISPDVNNSNYLYMVTDGEFCVYILDYYNNKIDKFLNNGTYLYSMTAATIIHTGAILTFGYDTSTLSLIIQYSNFNIDDNYFSNSFLKVFEAIKTYDANQGITIDVHTLRSSNIYSSDVEVYGKTLIEQTLGRFNWIPLDVVGGYYSYYNYTFRVSDNGNPDSFDGYAMSSFCRDADDASGNFHIEFINRDYTYGDYGIGMGFLHNTNPVNNKHPFIISPHTYYNFSGTYTGYSFPAISIATDGTRNVGINTEFAGTTLDVNGTVNLAGLRIAGLPGGAGQVLTASGTGSSVYWGEGGSSNSGGGGSFTQPLANLVVSNTVTSGSLVAYQANVSVLNVSSMETVSILNASAASIPILDSSTITGYSIKTTYSNASYSNASTSLICGGTTTSQYCLIGNGNSTAGFRLAVYGGAYITGQSVITNLSSTSSNITTLNVSSLQTVTSLRVTTSNITTLNVNSLSVSSLYGSNLVVSNSVTTTKIFTSGYVGIGTTSPTAMLDVVASTTADTGSLYAQIGSTSYSGRIKFYDQNTGTETPPYIYGDAGYGLGISGLGPVKIYGGSSGAGDPGTQVAYFATDQTFLNSQYLYLIGNILGSGGYANFSDAIGAGAVFARPVHTNDFHNYIYSSDGSVSQTYTLVVHDNDTAYGASLAPSCMVNFSRVENNNENNFHVEFVNISQNNADHGDYGIGMGFLDNGLMGTSTGHSPFIISTHTSAVEGDSAFSNASSSSDVALCIAVDGTKYVGINTADPRYQFDVSGDIHTSGVIRSDDGAELQGTVTVIGSLIPGNIITGRNTSYLLTTPDYYIGINGTGVTVTLPNVGLVTGKSFFIKDESGNAASNHITLSGNGYLIDGSATITMATNYMCLQVIWTGSFWSII
jgi:hypothetical protein